MRIRKFVGSNTTLSVVLAFKVFHTLFQKTKTIKPSLSNRHYLSNRKYYLNKYLDFNIQFKLEMELSLGSKFKLRRSNFFLQIQSNLVMTITDISKSRL